MIKYTFEIKDDGEVEGLTVVRDSNAGEVVESVRQYIESMLQTIQKNAASEEEKNKCYAQIAGIAARALMKYKNHKNVNEEEENND